MVICYIFPVLVCCIYQEKSGNLGLKRTFNQVLDVERMLAKSSMDLTAKGLEQGHPVIRTLYDHMEVFKRRRQLLR
jgi:hypothetical protein